MKITQVLCKHHIGWHFFKHWQVQGKKKPVKTNIVKALQGRGITIHNPEDILKEEKTFERVEVIGYKEKPVVFDESHPDWHENPIFQHGDNNVLVEGIDQAKILTRTIELQQGLPESFILREISKDTEKFAKQIVKYSNIFDAEQEKLPKIKDPQRPYHTFARAYGISQKRKIYLTVSKILQLLESTSDEKIVNDRYLFSDLLFQLALNRNDKQLQFQMTGDFFLSSSKPLTAVTSEPTQNISLTSMNPLDPTVSILKQHIYRLENIYPISATVKKKYPHTIFAFYNNQEVKNEFEEPITESQILGRSLLKAFTVAGSFARQHYGKNINILPEPVTVQCVHTDGCMFHFGILQLNTLDLEEDAVKNVWYQAPPQYLFENCSYQLAKPTLTGFNSEVLKYLYAFYNNV